MGITLVLEFGEQKYVCISLDTFSNVMWATSQPGERAVQATPCLRASFASVGRESQLAMALPTYLIRPSVFTTLSCYTQNHDTIQLCRVSCCKTQTLHH